MASTSFIIRGKCSYFGGPHDTGVSSEEGLALVDRKNMHKFEDYFLHEQPEGTSGLARRLNPDSHYIACRWNYNITPRLFLEEIEVTVKNVHNGIIAKARPVDWGPN